MMSPRTSVVISVVLASTVFVLASLTACHTSPPSRFYTLSATATPASTTSRVSLSVGPVTVPAVVDRPEFVINAGENEVSLEEFSRWASPLHDNLSCVVAANLVALLGSPRVISFPPTLPADVEYRVAIEVQRFESTPGKSAMIDAVWTVNRKADGKSETGRTTQRETVADDSYDALTAAHSRAVARMSEAIADAVRALEASAPQR